MRVRGREHVIPGEGHREMLGGLYQGLCLWLLCEGGHVRGGEWADMELAGLRNLSSLRVTGTIPCRLVPGSNAHGTGTVCWGGHPTREVVGSGLWRWVWKRLSLGTEIQEVATALGLW